MEQSGRTMLAKIWDQHVIAHLGEDTDLLHIDRHLLHDLGGSRGLLDLKSRGLTVHNPELTFATPDHAISTTHGRADTSKIGQELLASLRAETSASGIRLFDVDEPGQGIVHVIGPELGLSLPGCLIVCGDSHTCTHGGLGALAFGIGSSELTHVLATQALIQRRPKTMRVKFEGQLSLGVTAKDLILALIGHVGAACGTGYAVEYAGSAIRDLPVEGRLTICNLSIELGAKMGMIAPDEKTFEYIKGRPVSILLRMIGAAIALSLSKGFGISAAAMDDEPVQHALRLRRHLRADTLAGQRSPYRQRSVARRSGNNWRRRCPPKLEPIMMVSRRKSN